MMKLKHFDLDFEKTLAYFKDNLKGTNTLSNHVLKHITQGTFYTFLPHDTSMNDIHRFKIGGISKGPLTEKFPQFLLTFIQKNQNQLLLFDSCRVQPKKEFQDLLLLNHGRSIKNEVYFQVSGEEASFELLDQCYNRSYAIWHSLCILTEAQSLGLPNTEITDKELDEISKNIKMIFLLAYDGEGTVIWSKSNNTIKNIIIDDSSFVIQRFEEDVDQLAD